MLEKTDYSESRCPLCRDPEYRIPTSRVIEKLDDYFRVNDYEGALRHINYWIKDAEEGGDKRGLLSVTDEKMGICRKMALREEAVCAARRALELIEELGVGELFSSYTIKLNAATVFGAFELYDESLELFEEVKEGYERLLEPGDARLAGMYNNMAVTLAEQEMYDEAIESYDKAIKLMKSSDGAECEAAVSLLNMASLIEMKEGAENGWNKIESYLKEAGELLDRAKDDSRTAFALEKCAPVYLYYGFFGYAEDIKNRAKELYARERAK